MLNEVNLENIYCGFINSYNQFLFPAGDDDNYAQETHALIEYFRRLGLNNGYYPYCEYMQRDLEWYSEKDNDKSILHLEAENVYSRFDYTMEKIIDSGSPYAVAILWTNSIDKKVESKFRTFCKCIKTNKSILVIVRFSGRIRIRKGVLGYRFCGYELSKGKFRKLDAARILWPDEGFQTIEWEK